MTGWADEIPDDDLEEGEDARVDGDILGEVKGSGGRRRHRMAGPEESIPYAEQWETDLDAFQEGTVRVVTISTFHRF